MPLLKVLCFILHADLIVYCGLKGIQAVAAAAAAKEIHRLWRHLHLSYHFVPTHLSSPIKFYLLSGTSVGHFRSSGWWHYLCWALLAHPLELLTLTLVSFRRPALWARQSPFQTWFISLQTRIFWSHLFTGLLLLFSHQVVFDSFATPCPVIHRFLCLWNFPGKSTGVGCHFLLQGIFPTKGSNSHLLCCKWILYLWATREALFIAWFTYVLSVSPDLSPEKPVCRWRSNSQNWTWNNWLLPNWERSTIKLYIVTLLI